MVELKVRKFGNSLGIVLPKDFINRLHTKDGEPLFLIEAPDGGYRLRLTIPASSKRWQRLRRSSAGIATRSTRIPSDGPGLAQ